MFEDKIPEGSVKRLDFVWLLNEFRNGNLKRTLSCIKREELGEMLSEINYLMANTEEKKFQGTITEQKCQIIVDELKLIKDVFNTVIKTKTDN